ncbi:MAG: SDR family NAD(P)-dependent oxidoreductase [Alistipes sp.]|nr:SDR family NAD(P)-dependent oxidoreductase [Alistipes sp.]
MARRGVVVPGSKTALVTGASKGIGRSFALRLAAMGYNVLMVSLDQAELEATASEVSAVSDKVWVRHLVKDMAEMNAAEELFAWTKQQGVKVDVLINNAGMFSFCDILSTPVERIERMLLLHDMTATKMCRLYATDMAARGGGYILNMSSYSIWMPYPGLSLYSASKAYLKSFSVAFSKEVRDKGVYVTAICPAGIATDLYGLSPKLQRFGLKTGILMSPDSCARRSLNGLFRKQRCKVPDWWFRLFIPVCQMLGGAPMRWLRNFTMQFQK